MNRWCLCLDLYSIFVACLDQLRCFQCNILLFRHYQTITAIFHTVKCIYNPIAELFLFCHIFDLCNKIILIMDFCPKHIGKHLIIISSIDRNLNTQRTVCKIYIVICILFHIFIFRKSKMNHIIYVLIAVHDVHGILDHTLFDLIVILGYLQPLWYHKINTGDRKTIQHRSKDRIDIISAQLITVYGKNRNTIFIYHRCCKLFCFICSRSI